MSKKKTIPPASPEAEETTANTPERVEETPWEALASTCSVLVVGLFILTFLGQNFVIPSGSMENTLLVGDHLVVDRITLAAPAKGIPFVHYREPKRGDITVFIKPAMDTDKDGNQDYLILVKRLIGVPGDHIRLHNGVVYINGTPQFPPAEGKDSPPLDRDFLDEFPSQPPSVDRGATESWTIDFPNYIQNGELVVPPGKYFMMGDHRHNSLDSRYWGFVPRENIMGRPLLNYWSFKTPDEQYENSGLGNSVRWVAHVALRFFVDTRWSRTFHRVK